MKSAGILDLLPTFAAASAVNIRFVEMIAFFVVHLALVCFSKGQSLTALNEIDAEIWLRKNYNGQNDQLSDEAELAKWNLETNFTEINSKFAAEAESLYNQFRISSADKAKEFLNAVKQFKDASIQRQLRLISVVGIKLDYEDSLTLSTLKAQMRNSSISIKLKYCNESTDCPDWVLNLTEAERVKYRFEQAVYQLGRGNKANFQQLVELSNKGTKADGFKDTGDYWRSQYEDSDFAATLHQLYYDILPFYEQLHAYIRLALGQHPQYRYNSSAMPMYLAFTDVDSQFSKIKPFPNENETDLDKTLKEQNYTVLNIFQRAEDFFVSLGFSGMPESFWNASMFEEPTDRKVDCGQDLAAMESKTGKTYRMKACAEVSMRDWMSAHSHMAPIVYSMQYSKQPSAFKNAANEGIRYAVGDAIMLGSLSPKYLQRIGLASNETANDEKRMNEMFLLALQNFFFFPWYFAVDIWRWDVFESKSTVDHWNDDWRKVQLKYAGISHSDSDNKSDHFDLGYLYDIDNNIDIMRFIVNSVVEFQIFESLCNASGHTGPLHKCDFYGSKAAGKLLAEMLQLGASQPWPIALKVITGGSKMGVEPLLTYFQPLLDWLTEQNRLNNECFGWAYEWPPAVMHTLEKNRCGPTV